MQQQRYPTAIAAEFTADGARARGEIGNVALGGLFLQSRLVPEQGDMVRVRFEAPDGQPILVDGIVWWTTAGRSSFGRSSGFGVRLLDAPETYESFIDGLRAKQPATGRSRRAGRR